MLDIKKLYKAHDLKESIKLESYDEVFKQCCKRIQIVSDTGNLECWFIIPGLIIGKPPINTSECGKYVKRKMREYPIFAEFYPPNILYFNWSKNGKYAVLDNKISTEPISEPSTSIITQFVVFLVVILLVYLNIKYL